MNKEFKVCVWDRGDHITYQPVNPVIHSINAPKGERGDIMITTQDLVLDVPHAQCHALPQQIHQALLKVRGVEKVTMAPYGASGGRKQFKVTRGRDFTLEAMLEGLTTLDYPGDGTPLLSAEEIQQIQTTRPQRESVRNPFGPG